MFRVLRPAELSGKKPAKVNTRRDVLRTSADNNVFLQNSPVSKEFRFTPELVIVPWLPLPHFLEKEKELQGHRENLYIVVIILWTNREICVDMKSSVHVKLSDESCQKERESSKFFKVWFACISLSWSLSLVMFAKELTTSSCMNKAKINPGWRKRCHDLSNSDFKWDLKSTVFTLQDALTSKGCRTSQSVKLTTLPWQNLCIQWLCIVRSTSARTMLYDMTFRDPNLVIIGREKPEKITTDIGASYYRGKYFVIIFHLEIGC